MTRARIRKSDCTGKWLVYWLDNGDDFWGYAHLTFAGALSYALKTLPVLIRNRSGIEETRP